MVRQYTLDGQVVAMVFEEKYLAMHRQPRCAGAYVVTYSLNDKKVTDTRKLGDSCDIDFQKCETLAIEFLEQGIHRLEIDVDDNVYVWMHQLNKKPDVIRMANGKIDTSYYKGYVKKCDKWFYYSKNEAVND